MKNWSFGKIVGVFAGCFIGLIALVPLCISLISKSHKTGSSTTFQPITPTTTAQAAPAAPTQPKQAGAAAPSTTAQGAQRPADSDILETQLEDATRDKAKVQEALAAIQQQLQQSATSNQQNFAGMQTKIESLTTRVNALEHSTNGPVEIVKPKLTPRVSPTAKLAKTAKKVPASSGYKFQAAVSNRAWVKVGDREENVTIGDELPSASQPMRIKAVSADSGLFVVPDKQN